MTNRIRKLFAPWIRCKNDKKYCLFPVQTKSRQYFQQQHTKEGIQEEMNTYLKKKTDKVTTQAPSKQISKQGGKEI